MLFDWTKCEVGRNTNHQLLFPQLVGIFSISYNFWCISTFLVGKRNDQRQWILFARKIQIWPSAQTLGFRHCIAFQPSCISLGFVRQNHAPRLGSYTRPGIILVSPETTAHCKLLGRLAKTWFLSPLTNFTRRMSRLRESQEKPRAFIRLWILLLSPMVSKRTQAMRKSRKHSSADTCGVFQKMRIQYPQENQDVKKEQVPQEFAFVFLEQYDLCVQILFTKTCVNCW